MEEKKDLMEFLIILVRLTQNNIDYIKDKEMHLTLFGKYKEEILKIQDLINSFDFVKDKENG